MSPGVHNVDRIKVLGFFLYYCLKLCCSDWAFWHKTDFNLKHCYSFVLKRPRLLTHLFYPLLQPSYRCTHAPETYLNITHTAKSYKKTICPTVLCIFFVTHHQVSHSNLFFNRDVVNFTMLDSVLRVGVGDIRSDNIHSVVLLVAFTKPVT